MKKKLKRFTGLILCLAIIVGTLPANFVVAAVDEVTVYQPTDQAITIKSEVENTITILPEETEPSESEEPVDVNGLLDIQAGTYTVERDYEQTCMITITNVSDQTVEFYLEATNEYEDLSLEIIKAGSDESPIVIQAGETLEVELSVFAQNAENESYRIPVTAYVAEGDAYTEDAQSVVMLNCELPILDLVWTLISENETTLRQKWQIKNTGDTVTDLVLFASGDAADYLNFDPIVSNFGLASGETLEFTVQPDLAKMKNNGLSILTGSLVASSAGKTSTVACSFDTKGEEIAVTTMGQLALQQSGNPFTDFDVVEDSITAEYFDGTEYVNAESLSLEEIFDEDGMFHGRVTVDVDLGMDEPFMLGMETKSTLVAADTEIDETVSMVQLEDGTYAISFKRLMTMEEYKAYITEAKELAVEYGVAAYNEENMIAMIAETTPVLYSSASDYAENPNKALVEDIFLMDSAFDAMNEVVDFGYPSVVGKLSNIYDVYQIMSEADKTVDVMNNPNISEQTKVSYYGCYLMKGMLLGGGIVVGFTCPYVGFFFGLASSWLQGMIDELQDQLLEEEFAKYAELLDKIQGRQCTNRGSITADFYAPDFGLNTSTEDTDDPILYVKSRLYADGNGYVNKTDTNYDITLNGEHAGSSSTSGLTELVMEEISTGNLKPGEVNRLVFDYDTSPGSYSVSTDTEITLLYPVDTEIGYIGNPNELDDVRIKPDVSVYPENIFVEDELIAGEATTLVFNVYNIGSKGGWFNITVTDGTTEIFFEENYYLSAFSSERFSVMWTPTAETSEITVTLVNTSVNLKERDSTNNIATKTLTVREREVPAVEDVYTDTVYENSAYMVSADVSSYADVTGVAFYVDGTALEGTVKSSVSSGKTRYWLTTSDVLSVGEHSGTVKVAYSTGVMTNTVVSNFTITVLEREIQIPTSYSYSADPLLYGENYEFYVANTESLTRVEVSIDGDAFAAVKPASTDSNKNFYIIDTTAWAAGEHAISVNMYYQSKEAEELVTAALTVTTVSEGDSYFLFTLDETITNPFFRLFDEYGYSESYSMETLEDGTYRFKKTADMYENPECYTLFVKHDSGLIAHTLNENGTVFSTTTCNTLSIIPSDQIQITYMDVEKTGSLNHSDIAITVSDELYFTPGQYTVYISGNFAGQYFSTRTTVDLTSGNQTIYAEDLFLNYQFLIENPEYSWYGAKVYYRNKGNTYWNSFSMNTDFNTESGLLTCFTASSSYIGYVENAEEVRVVIYSDAEVYVTQVKSPVAEVSVYALAAVAAEDESDEIITLSRDDLHEVSLVCGEKGLTIENVEVSDGDFSVMLYADMIYLPAGDYTLTTTVDTGNQTLFNEVFATILSDCEVVVDTGLSDNLTDVIISWAEQYDAFAYVRAYANNGKYISASQFAFGSSFKVETGSRSVYVDLYQGNNSYSFYRYLNNLTDEGTQISIGSELTAIVDEPFGTYDSGARISFYLDNIQDANGNTLNSWSVSSSQPFYGNAVFTDVEDETHAITVPFTTTSRRIYLYLPEEAGTYRMTVELYSYATEVGTEHIHTEVIDYAVDATCTTDGLTQGSHCSVCGEVIVEQIVIPATGHTLNYFDNGDGAHTVFCDKGDYSAIENHDYQNGVCILCGATNPEEPVESTNPEESDTPVAPVEPDESEDDGVQQPDESEDNGIQQPEETNKADDGDFSDTEATKETDSNVKTGDKQNLILWAVLLVVAVAGLAVVFFTKKKRSSK